MSESNGESGKYEDAHETVERLIKDFDAGNVTRRDAERVKVRTDRAIHDMDGYRGITSR